MNTHRSNPSATGISRPTIRRGASGPVKEVDLLYLASGQKGVAFHHPLAMLLHRVGRVRILYVACTRARDHVAVIGAVPGSDFVADLIDGT